jgi:hypothetical protein
VELQGEGVAGGGGLTFSSSASPKSLLSSCSNNSRSDFKKKTTPEAARQAEKTLGKHASLPRAKQKALGTERNTRHRFLYREPNKKLSAKKI